MPSPARSVRTSSLEIVYDEGGPPSGAPVLLMHGWPYGPRVYDAVVSRLVEAGCRTIVPYLRGFGPTRFLSPRYTAIRPAGRARRRPPAADERAQHPPGRAGRI